jgi:hypothetical protein
MSRTRVCLSCRALNRNINSEVWSASWRSSSTIIKGCTSAMLLSRRASESNSRNRSSSGFDEGTACSLGATADDRRNWFISGSKSTTCGASDLSRLSMRVLSASLRQHRTIWIHGQ